MRLPVTLTLVLVVLASPPAAAGAVESPHPLPGYRPTFVTQTDVRPPWNNCLWAAAAMFVDKLTAGHVLMDHRTLRELSGDRDGGSSFADLRVAFAALGLPLATSPDGGAFITWRELTRRLAAGAGAIVLGDYSSLPRRYGRWDRTLWAAEGDADNHALYLDGYDRRRDRVFVMDPLGRGRFAGEWVPASAVRAFTWRTGGGGLWAAVTPSAAPAPFSDATLDPPVAVRADGAMLDVAWPVLETPPGWQLPAAHLDLTAVAAEDPLDPALAHVVAAPPPPLHRAILDDWAGGDVPPVAPPPDPVLRIAEGALRASVAIPTEPGAWLLEGTVVSPRFAGPVPGMSLDGVVLFVPGERVAEIAVPPRPILARGGAETVVPIVVRNAGRTDWAGVSRDWSFLPPRFTRLVGHWVFGDEGSPRRDPVELGRVELAAGAEEERVLRLAVPSIPGRWWLVLDLVDSEIGSFAAAGSRPAIVAVVVSPVQERID